MKSEGPSRRKDGVRDLKRRDLIYQLAQEAVDSEGWVELEGLNSWDSTDVYIAIGRMVAQVAYRRDIMYARMERRDT